MNTNRIGITTSTGWTPNCLGDSPTDLTAATESSLRTTKSTQRTLFCGVNIMERQCRALCLGILLAASASVHAQITAVPLGHGDNPLPPTIVLSADASASAQPDPKMLQPGFAGARSARYQAARISVFM